MRTSEERVAELHRRMQRRRHEQFRRRYHRLCAAVAASCLALVALFAIGFFHMPIKAPDVVIGSVTASAFASHAALAYVVIVIVAFCLGVTATVLCVRLKRYMENEENRNDREI